MLLPQVSFTHLAYLILLLLLPGLWWVSQRSLAGLPAGRARLALGLRCALVAALVFALAGTQITRPTKRLAVLFLLDRSHSIPDDHHQRELDFVNEAAARMGPNDRAGVLVFGSDAYLEVEPSAALRLDRIHSLPARDYTDIAGALRLAMAAFPDDAQKRIVLLTDGNENLGSALQEALGANAAGIQVDVVPIRYHYQHEVLLEKLLAPAEAKVGEPFEVRAIVNSTYAGQATLRFFRDRQLVESRPVALRPGKNLIRFPQTLTRSRPHTFEAVVEAQPDQLPDNNRALALTLVRGRPRVLLVSADPEDARFLAAALRTQQIEVDVRAPGQLPASLADFQTYDSLILCNVGADQLTPDQMKMIRSNVRDLGAGLIMVGGEQSFGPGAWRGTPVEEALPVNMEIRKERVMPSGAVALVLHTCEFPDGTRWARETAAAVVDVLGEEDKIGVLLYSPPEEWGLPMQPARDKDFLKTRIFQLNPLDMPDFHRIMSMAYDGLRKTDARVKHIIVISDGDPQSPTSRLLQEITRAKISISTVAVFPHDSNGVRAMQQMARATGGRFYQVQQAEEIPRIFLKEAQRVLKPAIIEEVFQPQAQMDAPLLKGLGVPPPLRGYVATTAKQAPGVEIVIASHKNDPVLATWRFGLGKAVAFTSDATNKWAAPWLVRWGGRFNQFWAQVVRWTIRSTARASFETSVEISERRGRVVIDALDEQGNFLNFLDIRGGVASERRSLDLRLEQTAPGRYEGTFDAPDTGQYIISLSYQDPKVGQRLYTVGASVPYSPEYASLQANEPVLTGLAERTGGRLHPGLTPDPSSGYPRPSRKLSGQGGEWGRILFRHDRPTHAAPVDLWPLLVLVTAWLLLADIAVRRVMVSPREVWGWLWAGLLALLRRTGILRSPRAGMEQPSPEPLVRLRRAKEQARQRVATGSGPGRIAEPAGAAAPPPAARGDEAASPPAAGTQAAEPSLAPTPKPSRPAVAWSKSVPGVPAAAGPSDPDFIGTGARPDAVPAADASATEPEDHTSRLLRAKRRARGQDE
ncbi:MAG: VWA domain-containing protein [Armatimonadetes bacterium]|nr:VWA domain-containing protein [Armatimonadota bacterium]